MSVPFEEQASTALERLGLATAGAHLDQVCQ